ncbi:hypothetical protein O181_037057 [Austropuccinia psidii MF-1]|uniref:DUF4939 domain-containing protein n=1 Tax=Austropuccinia psidii MF-1 TaxID=1389203 RepID=A0A9Q3DBX2_9BASI|nr:hypothetical protein [Austropuccinia psidii MF-1]
MRPKGASQVGPKPQLGPPEPFFATSSLDPKVTRNLMDTILAINPVGPNFGHGPPWTNSSAMASGNHQRSPHQLSPPFASTPGDFFLSSIPSVLKVAGMVHIWYYIPLCTIFAQQSNGDYFLSSFGALQTRSQAQTQAVLTPTPRVPLDGTPAVPQLRGQLDRGLRVEGAAPFSKEGIVPRRSNFFSGVVGSFPGISRTSLKGPGEDGEEEEENFVEEEESDGTEGVPAPVGASQGTGGPALAQSNQTVSHQSEPSLLTIMQQITHIIANLQVASSSEASRLPDFKSPSMKAPECLYGTQTLKVGSFIESCQLIFHNDLANLCQDREKALYAISFPIGRAVKWIEPYLSNLTNQDPNYLLNSWQLFESQLITLFGDPNEVREAEADLDFHPGFWISWPPILQDFTDITLELDTRYHDRQKEKSHHQEKKPEASKDEVFKEIQDAGEDNSVSSLHFFGNIDLPSSSYHDSLEELWDEEEDPEEIETVMKVVPSVYHQYLEVFYKVKAEKPPPNRACDHHIELDGSLPLVWVIYSLSNQE